MIQIPNDLLAKLMTIAAGGFADHPAETTPLTRPQAALMKAGFDEFTPEGLWAAGELEVLMENDPDLD